MVTSVPVNNVTIQGKGKGKGKRKFDSTGRIGADGQCYYCGGKYN
jgi:hypothetical protein